MSSRAALATPRAACSLAAVCALLVVAPAARAADAATSLPGTAPNATPTIPAPSAGVLTGTPPPDAPAVRPPVVVRLLRMPPTLTDAGLRQLVAELTVGASTTDVVLRAGDGAQIAAGDFAALADASKKATLFVLDDKEPSSVTSLLHDHGVVFRPVSSATELQRRIGTGLTVVDGGTLSGPSLAGLTTDARGGGGLSLLPIALAGALALLAAFAVAGRRPRRQPAARLVRPEPAPTTVARRPVPSRHASARPRAAPLAHDPRLPDGGRALVRTELAPEGYVELESCLRRARWVDASNPPPAPGGWVDVRSDGHGRLTAWPAGHGAKAGRS